MTAYRFRVKFDPDPTSLWRDIVVGADRTIDEVENDALRRPRNHVAEQIDTRVSE